MFQVFWNVSSRVSFSVLPLYTNKLKRRDCVKYFYRDDPLSDNLIVKSHHREGRLVNIICADSTHILLFSQPSIMSSAPNG